MIAPRRVFEIVIGDFRRTGGMDRANYALAETWLNRGDEVHLVAHRAGALRDRPDVGAATRVPGRSGSYLLGESAAGPRRPRLARRTAARRARVVVNGGNCPVAATSTGSTTSTPRGRPRTARGRRDGGSRRRLGPAGHRAAERTALGRARLAIANSERTRRDLIERLGVPAERVRTIYYGMDPERFRPRRSAEAGRGPRASWAGRPTGRWWRSSGRWATAARGSTRCSTAWAAARARPGWDARLVVVGAGAEPAGVAGAGRGRGARRLGRRSSASARTCRRSCAACDALVSPTRYEAYGLNVHEALCCGLPALVSASAGVAERYPDAPRLLLPDPEDAADLAARLRRWRDDLPEARARFGRLGERLRRRTWDDMAAEIVALIEA